MRPFHLFMVSACTLVVLTAGPLAVHAAVVPPEQNLGPASEQELARMRAFIEAESPKRGRIRTVRLADGDEVDCVRMEEQPALHREGTRRRQLERQPQTFPVTPKGMDDGSWNGRSGTRPERHPVVQTYAVGGPACPENTVPIRRLTLDVLKNFRTLEDFFSKHPTYRRGTDAGGLTSQRLGSTREHQYALAGRAVANRGAESVLDVWSPYTERPGEFSNSQIWVWRGSGADYQSVEAGWHVYNYLYGSVGDGRSRLFIYSTSDNYSTGRSCYNLYCDRFVQVTNKVMIGGTFTQYSIPGSLRAYIRLFWFKDGPNGHWWLRFNDIWLGYYPRDLFDAQGLRDYASGIQFGGEIYDEPSDGRHTYTNMGSGHWPSRGLFWAATQSKLAYTGLENYRYRALNLNRAVTDQYCYDLRFSNRTTANPDLWEHIYFGGPGDNPYCL